MDDTKHLELRSSNTLITDRHLYRHEADLAIAELVKSLLLPHTINQVVELGCGRGRLLPLITQIENIEITAIDNNPEYIKFAKAAYPSLAEHIHLADIETYKPTLPVHIFYSMGIHHLMLKQSEHCEYLKKIYQQLLPGGYYILADEFLPDYIDEQEREVNLVVWYAHIISQALKHSYRELALEEAKILLDDILKQRQCDDNHSLEQIQMVLNDAPEIADAANYRNIDIAKTLSLSLIDRLDAFYNGQDNRVKQTTSFTDSKICDRVLRKQLADVGFKVIDITTIGPDAPIGAVCVYTLKKTS